MKWCYTTLEGMPQQHVVEHGGHDETLSKSLPSTASNCVPSCLDLFLLLDPDSFGLDSEADICATLLHYNPSYVQIMTSHHITQTKSCGNGESVKQQVWIH